jgi:glyoxylase-like metal-dependent hydrolase (beta-lactamase superfamily II)
MPKIIIEEDSMNKISKLILAYTALLCGTNSSASTTFDPIDIEGNYSADRFAVSTEIVAEGVYLLRRSPTWRTSVQGNVTVIVNEEDVVVVDGGHPPHVKNVIAAIKDITDKPISRVITTHWHQDHNWGNYLYKKAYPNVKIISHINTQKTLKVYEAAQKPEQYADPERVKKAQESYRQRVAEAKAKNASEEEIAFLVDTAKSIPELYEALTPPQDGVADIAFEDKLILQRGDRTIEILFLGRANTDGDAVIWLPKEKVVIAGDIIVQPTPFGFGSYPSEWADTIDRILALDYQIMIPGHGPLIRDTRYPLLLTHLFRDLTKQTQKAVAEGATTTEALAEKVDFTAHDKAIAVDNPLYARIFQNWFKTPILESALKEALGEPISQTQYVEE